MESSPKTSKQFNMLVYINHILPYLSPQELLTQAKLNKKFKSSVEKFSQLYYNDFLDKFSELYSIDQEELKQYRDLNLISFFKQQSKILMQSSKANYIQIKINLKKTYYCGARDACIWAWNENSSYWTKGKDSANSIFGGFVPYLKNVCWLHIGFAIRNVLPGRYKAFIRQKFNNIHTFDNAKIDFFVKVSYKHDTETQIKLNRWVPSNMLTNVKKDIYEKYYIGDILIDEDKFKLSKESNILFEFDGTKNPWWKSGWWIDGAILEEISDKN